MTWLQRYRIRHYFRNSIWIAPLVAIVLAIVAVRVLHDAEVAMGWYADLNVETTRTVLGTLAGTTFTLVVFVCSSLLLVLQLASAQLTPRVIAAIFRDRITKLALATFVFVFVFLMSLLVRIGTAVPAVTTHIAAYGCAATLGAFLFLIDHVGKMLRPGTVVRSIASTAHQIIEIVYPRRLRASPENAAEDADLRSTNATKVVKCRTGGVVLAVDVSGLVALARRHDGVIELVPQVGEFVAPGDPLFRVHGGAPFGVEALHQSIALGAERTIEQDPAFAFRVIVDIALKGLSPAINDPTTAVLAIDQIHHLLRHIGNRKLDNAVLRDASGRARLSYRTPDWEDFLKLAITEIRQFGGNSIQVIRRLRAMLDDLVRALPERRRESLEEELLILNRTAQRMFAEPEDQLLAGASDSQGMGGTSISPKKRNEFRSKERS